MLDPFRFLLISVVGWMNQPQQLALDYSSDENRILKQQLGDKRLRLNDEQRRRLASKAKQVGHRLLARVATIVTPETLLAWHGKLIAQKHNGTAHRAFCIDLGKRDFPGCYDDSLWGISASDSAHGYVGWGGPARDGPIDGTVVPCAAGGSLMFERQLCL